MKVNIFSIQSTRQPRVGTHPSTSISSSLSNTLSPNGIMGTHSVSVMKWLSAAVRPRSNDGRSKAPVMTHRNRSRRRHCSFSASRQHLAGGSSASTRFHSSIPGSASGCGDGEISEWTNPCFTVGRTQDCMLAWNYNRSMFDGYISQVSCNILALRTASMKKCLS